MPSDRDTSHFPHGISCFLPGAGYASDYANTLLTGLGADVRRSGGAPDAHPAVAWAVSGMMALTGSQPGEAQMCPAPLASCADGVVMALSAVAGPNAALLPASGGMLLGERAAIAGLQRSGPASPGGACRLLRCVDGWLAVNLARSDDWALLPAWLEGKTPSSWEALAAALAARQTTPLVERAHLMGLAAAELSLPAPQAPAWFETERCGSPRTSHLNRRPLVIDLSSLWAGPLCSHLLQMLGARVIRLESRQRPDGSRLGPPAFDNLLNAGKQCVALDFDAAADRARLRQLLRHADIVIEASRPRALRQLGIYAEEMLRERPGLSWVSISGYGRKEPAAGRAAYGDDAGVAAGLSGLLLETTGQALICGDAIADPLTGLHAALAALASHRGGGGNLISLGLCNVVAHCAAFTLPATEVGRRARWQSWQALAQDAGLAETRPQARPATGRAQPVGADTSQILEEFGIRC